MNTLDERCTLDHFLNIARINNWCTISTFSATDIYDHSTLYILLYLMPSGDVLEARFKSDARGMLWLSSILRYDTAHSAYYLPRPSEINNEGKV